MGNTDVAIQAVYPIIKSLARIGCDTDRFCREAGFDASLLKDAEARIASAELERLMTAAAAYTKDDHFGLHQGLVTEFADIGLVGYVMTHTATIGEALAAYRRYNDLLSSGFDLEWEAVEDFVEIRFFLQQSSGTISRHCVEDMASSIYTMMGRLANRRIVLRGVRFMHEAPPVIEPYRQVFGQVPDFGAKSHSLIVDADVLAYPVLYSDARLLQLFEAKADEKKEELAGAERLTEQVAQWLKQNLPAQFPSLQQTADAFLMSTRSLQAKLKKEGSSFKELTVRVRKEAAMRYLRKPEISVGEVAYALHFTEQSAFQSAFKKWTGQTPGQFRMQHVQQRTGM